MDDRPPISNDEADTNTTGDDENDKNSGSSSTTDDDDNKNDDDENNNDEEDNDTDEVDKDEDGECLASLMAALLPRRNKPHSYSQQLTPTISHHEIITKRNTRKHNLDEIQISRNLAADFDSSSNDERSRIASVLTDGPEFMSQFLERGESDASEEEGSSRGGDRPMRTLPEFIGAGGGSGMFKVPVRAERDRKLGWGIDRREDGESAGEREGGNWKCERRREGRCERRREGRRCAGRRKAGEARGDRDKRE